MPEPWRLFIAVELPPDVITLLTEIQARLKQQIPRQTVRWVDPHGIHLTLKFLGDAPVAQRKDLETALARVAEQHTVFDLATGTLGCFPNVKRPRVVWISVSQNLAALHALRDAVEDAISPLGYPTENRPFSPHLTLGRVHREARHEDVTQTGALIEKSTPGGSVRWRVDGVSLMRSELKPSGAVYTELLRAPLRPG